MTSCLISSVKDEGPWLIEWVAHNLVLGFDNTVIAYNDCSDGTDRILAALHEAGVIRCFENAPPYAFKGHIQRTAFERARDLEVVADSEWLMALDADEFLNIHLGEGRIGDLIDHQDTGADTIVLNWRCFGSAGISAFEDVPVTERFTRCAGAEQSTEPHLNQVKHLYRRHAAYRFVSPHGGVPGAEGMMRNMRTPSGRVIAEDLVEPGVPWRNPLDVPEWSAAQINHYVVKSREEYAMRARRGEARGRDKYHQAYFRKNDTNDECDTSISRYDAEKREVMARLMKIEGVAELHARSIAWHKAALGDAKIDGALSAS